MWENSVNILGLLRREVYIWQKIITLKLKKRQSSDKCNLS